MLNLNEIKYGFKLEEIREVKDINAKFYRFNHLKSGGTVVYLQTNDKNSTFAIGFKTLPEDSTGVCHIIEHSTLCGSKKYPLKEPFVNLLKGSLATFLNAFTSYDWTMYPCSSQTPKDFDNIVDVYLDAVFNPISMVDEKPFLQEGWHLELSDKDATPFYNGVVYNEMKGAMASVDERLVQTSLEAMYKGTGYAENSGGEPSVIPTLTYENYKAFYHAHYNPQNALTVFYGDMDIEEKLKHLDEEYFSKYDKVSNPFEIPMPKPLINTEYERDYSIGEAEPLENNTYMSLVYALDNHENVEDILGMNILFDALFGENNSPLKKKMLDAHLGEDIEYYIDDSCILPALHIHLEKSNHDCKEKFRELFVNSVKELVENGIDKKILLASINRYEFKDKEQDKPGLPKGIDFAMKLMNGFNYHYDLVKNLEFSESYKKFHNELNNGYFEKLLEKYILNSNHYVEVVLNPSHTLAKEEKEAMDKKMLELKNSLTDEEKEELIKKNKELLAYQNHVDTPQELKKLPKLNLTDIDKNVNFLQSKKFKVNGMNGIYHPLDIKQIGYVNLYFDMNKVSFEDLPYCFLLRALLLNVPTSKYDVTELNTIVKTYLGSFDFQEQIFSNSKDTYHALFEASLRALSENFEYIPVLLNEVLLHSSFTKTEVLQTLKQLITMLKQEMFGNGHVISSDMVNACTSKQGAIIAKGIHGPKLYDALIKMAESFDIKEIKAKLKDICTKLFNKKNVTISVACNEETFELLKNSLREIKLPRKESDELLEVELNNTRKEALVIPSEVSYNALGFNLEDLNLKIDGKYQVLNQILSYDYLWPEVRVKGGAYGCFMLNLKNNDISFTSYRDSNVTNTYNVYKALPEYLRGFKPTKDLFKSYIIGTLANFDKPVPNYIRIAQSDSQYFLGITKKDRIQLKKEVLSTKIEDINAFAEVFEEALKNSFEYTIGNKDKIALYQFDKVEDLK